MTFKKNNKNTEQQWIKRHRYELIELGLPYSIFDDFKLWHYFLLHGEDYRQHGWDINKISKQNITKLLNLLTTFYTNPTGYELIKELERRKAILTEGYEGLQK